MEKTTETKRKLFATCGMLFAVLFLCILCSTTTVKANGLTGLAVGDDGQWHYYADGNIDWNYNGLQPNEYGWWKITDGTVDFGYTGLVYDENVGWWYVENGTINFGFNGLVFNEYGWWKITGGTVDFGFNGLAYNENGWWKCNGGTVDFGFTGLACNENGWFYFENGALNWNYTGMAYNEYGWWYVVDGVLDWDYYGIGTNEYGSWFYQNGKLDWNYSGIISWNGQDYTVVNGYATAEKTEHAHEHNYTWTYVSDGDYKVNKCSCGNETGERAYNLGNGVYGQWKDSMASDLMTWTNLQRGNTTTVPLDEVGNYLPMVVSPPLNNTLSSQAKTRALQCVSDYSYNGMITIDECLAQGYDNARSVSSAWMESPDHRDSSVYYLYTQGGTACLWYDSDGNGTMTYIWVLVLDGDSWDENIEW